mmetsp:Transcript_41331/g.93251  ORF Transcript_41331/g.93251 Transcript_41331/m.93251 type:complete len:207 (-) Transcript_41331:65-685(-)
MGMMKSVTKVCTLFVDFQLVSWRSWQRRSVHWAFVTPHFCGPTGSPPTSCGRASPTSTSSSVIRMGRRETSPMRSNALMAAVTVWLTDLERLSSSRTALEDVPGGGTTVHRTPMLPAGTNCRSTFSALIPLSASDAMACLMAPSMEARSLESEDSMAHSTFRIFMLTETGPLETLEATPAFMPRDTVPPLENELIVASGGGGLSPT